LRILLTFLQLLYGYRLRFGIMTKAQYRYMQSHLLDSGTIRNHSQRCNKGVEESVERACIFGRLGTLRHKQ
jgi:hypothetical protein